MIRLVSRVTLLAAVGLAAASVVMAGVPNLTNSTINAAPQGNKILLSGHNAAGTGTDAQPNYVAYFTKLITVRDAANNPVANSVVILNFNSCYGINGLRLGSIQPGLTVNAGARSVSAVTNGSGVATFKVCGGGNHTGGNADPDAIANCIQVTADGVPIGSLTAAYFDQNGADCITIGDFGLFANDYNATQSCPGGSTANYRARSDYNMNGARPCPASGPNNDVSDFGFFANAYTQSGFGGVGGGGTCPAGGSTGPMIP